MDHIDICIVGAGVIGLAIAHKISSDPRHSHRSVVLLERESAVGQHISSRNSEVIHAGIYYSENSLKASLCVRGKQLLYEHCRQHRIPFKRTGKLIVAQERELEVLLALQGQAEANGVDDLELIARQGIHALEPAVKASHALLSPSTGIIDSHQYLQSLQHLSQNAGVELALRTQLDQIEPVSGTAGFRLDALIEPNGVRERYRFHCDTLINCAGLDSQGLALSIPGITSEMVPELHPCKGDYFAYSGKNPFNHLIYPLPEPNTQGLGVHATTDLTGQLRFGPDSNYVDRIDYEVQPNKAEAYAAAISRYFPAIEAWQLQASYAGIRPKIAGAGAPAADFLVQDGADFGMGGLIQLFGIESPGLTASLAIGEMLANMLCTGSFPDPVPAI